MTSFNVLDSEAEQQPYWLLGQVDADYQQVRSLSQERTEALTDRPSAPYRVFLSNARRVSDSEAQVLMATPSGLRFPISAAVQISFDTRKRDKAAPILGGLFDQLIVLEPYIRFLDQTANTSTGTVVQRLGRIQGLALIRRVPPPLKVDPPQQQVASARHDSELVASADSPAAVVMPEMQGGADLSASGQGLVDSAQEISPAERQFVPEASTSDAISPHDALRSSQRGSDTHTTSALIEPAGEKSSASVPAETSVAPSPGQSVRCLFCRPLWVVFLAVFIYLSLDGTYAALYILITATACVISRLSSVSWPSSLGNWGVFLLWLVFIGLSFDFFSNKVCLISSREAIAILATSLLFISAWVPSTWIRCLSHALWLICCLLLLLQSPWLCSQEVAESGSATLEQEAKLGKDEESGGTSPSTTDRLIDLAETAKNSLWKIISGDTLDRDVRELNSSSGVPLGGREVLSEFEGWFPSRRLCDKEAGQTQVIYLGEDAVFQKDSSELSPRAVGVVQRLSKVLNRAEIESIDVVGHSDPSGGDDYNLVLSQARAINLRDILLNYVRLPAYNVSAFGLGGGLPLFSRDQMPSPLDRRVEVVIVCGTHGNR